MAGRKIGRQSARETFLTALQGTFMLSDGKATFALGLLIFITTGCGGAETSAPVMTEPKHSHYHVHAADASHEHSHADDKLGGHEHSHQHPESGHDSNE
jgi:hypothetical protein